LRNRKDESRAIDQYLQQDPPYWIENNFFVSDPRDPVTGEQFSPGPLRLATHQKQILRAALTKIDGLFPYSTILYSTIKKSGKTRIAAAVGMWFAATQGDYNEVYCLANDGKQSSDRLLAAIKQCLALNPTLGWSVTKTRIDLPNGTFIESIPCDPTGQAGSNPGLTLWSEMWGYHQEYKARLWSEMTIPPTRFGKALRWVESYAGFTGESNVLENLYSVGVQQARRHPMFTEIPVYVNSPAKMLAYWDQGDEARRMPWQTAEYYAQEEKLLTPNEFDRIHRNYWAAPIDKAIPIEWWDNCYVTTPALDKHTPLVIGVDAGITHDSSALVVVSRNPSDKNESCERYTKIWYPPSGGKIDLDLLEQEIVWWCQNYNVVEVTYDKYQLHKMMTDLRKRGLTRFKEFDQNAPRALADKQLYDMIINRTFTHSSGNVDLRTHADNAGAKDDGKQYRFVKQSSKLDKSGATARPIDALVALSMANFECMRLLLA